jgi:DNA-binding PadR family transcriptional regulator
MIMSLKYGLLGFLNSESMTGCELEKECKKTLGYFWKANIGQIYRTLDSMEQCGWLTTKRVMQGDNQNVWVYSITVKGKSEFLDWLSSPNTTAEHDLQLKNTFLMRVFFTVKTDRKQALDLLHSYHDVCLARIIEMDELKVSDFQKENGCSSEQYTYLKLTALYGEVISRARFEWVRKAIMMLENMD